MSGKKITMILGVVFLVLGLLGLVGGVGIVGPEGLFVTNGAHDWVHIITGLIFILVAWKSAASSGMLLKIFGIIYVLVAILGFISGDGYILGFLMSNVAADILHLILGVLMLWGGFMGARKMMSSGMGGGTGMPNS